jgi:hypothetical protein
MKHQPSISSELHDAQYEMKIQKKNEEGKNISRKSLLGAGVRKSADHRLS